MTDTRPEHTPRELRDDDGGPVVAIANWYRFRPGERIVNPDVQSVFFIWAVDGEGTVSCQGKRFDLSPGTLLRLPWRHRVEYTADRHHPFHVGTVHVVPWHAFGVTVVPHVPHDAGDPLGEDSHRRGDAIQGPAAFRLNQNAPARSLVELGSYAVETLIMAPFDETVARALGVLILREDERMRGGGSVLPSPPSRLGTMVDYIAENLDRPLTLTEIVRIGDCSIATAERLFREHKGSSLGAWVRAERMRAAALLLRTTGLNVREVASRVGYEDPLYFSRVFRNVYDVPPSRYATPTIRP
ncbi:AraC family transcriptional regulator [Microbacterium murale]|uniref:HTH araC/xylS-type domain-containing protein n=1 Tax=Microbacterium murale TaxID=1081040 RepID=A0ABQ1RZC5_9MICO|nr:AraC family transcriptional regulator [Microbacterium murale]GGD86165.1 hypothetical protein GCM10007269_31350 [Microbacterium murale]